MTSEPFPVWAVIVAAIAAALITGVIVGAVIYYMCSRRNRRVGTRNYRYPPLWMLCGIAALCVGGCMERAVIVPPTVPVRLAEHLRGVAVWVKEAGGGEVKARADLFPGMIIVTDPKDFPTATRAKFMNLRKDE